MTAKDPNTTPAMEYRALLTSNRNADAADAEPIDLDAAVTDLVAFTREGRGAVQAVKWAVAEIDASEPTYDLIARIRGMLLGSDPDDYETEYEAARAARIARDAAVEAAGRG